MRLFTKIFLCGTMVFSLAFSISGYFLLHYSLESSLDREMDFAMNQYQYDKFTVQSAFITYEDTQVAISIMDGDDPGKRYYTVQEVIPDAPSRMEDPEESAESLFRALAEEIDVPVAFFEWDKTLIYSEIEGLDLSFLDGLSENSHVCQFWKTQNGSSVLTGSILPGSMLWYSQDMHSVYFVTQWDISKTVGQQETMRQYFIHFYLTAMALGMALLGIFSAFMTKPLKKMAKAARRMADGYYEERLAISGGDEIGELAGSFNLMAGAVEEKIGELSRAAREKEDFVANFAHELKTPLTSIIGYADMIYQREMPRQEIQNASWYIWNEGMRLEALALKLMDLTVLGRQEFPLQEMPAAELLQDVAEGLQPLFREKKIDFSLAAEAAYVRADYDLLKTLLINLVDNSMKAGGTRIELSGQLKDGRYSILVRDNGCGMEEAELARITEAFYMVDKARSRKQHGAGLGLALADRIAGIHGSALTFASKKGEGTEVGFWLELWQGE